MKVALLSQPLQEPLRDAGIAVANQPELVSASTVLEAVVGQYHRQGSTRAGRQSVRSRSASGPAGGDQRHTDRSTAKAEGTCREWVRRTRLAGRAIAYPEQSVIHARRAVTCCRSHPMAAAGAVLWLDLPRNWRANASTCGTRGFTPISAP
jgi:hypothetical protein